MTTTSKNMQSPAEKNAFFQLNKFHFVQNTMFPTINPFILFDFFKDPFYDRINTVTTCPNAARRRHINVDLIKTGKCFFLWFVSWRENIIMLNPQLTGKQRYNSERDLCNTFKCITLLWDVLIVHKVKGKYQLDALIFSLVSIFQMHSNHILLLVEVGLAFHLLKSVSRFENRLIF